MSSPIESALINSLLLAIPRMGHPLFVFPAGCDPLQGEARDAIRTIDPSPGVERMKHLVLMFPQALVDRYKVDVLLLLGPSQEGRHIKEIIIPLAVECDGHEWHERTRQQAASDRARDRHLLLRGVTTIRFTGSDIHHDDLGCATECVDVLRALFAHASHHAEMALKALIKDCAEHPEPTDG